MPCLPKRSLRIDQVPKRLDAVRAFMELSGGNQPGRGQQADRQHTEEGGSTCPRRSTAHCCSSRAEQALGDAFVSLQPEAEALYARGDYTAMLRSLAPLKLPVDRFFDDVMVNVDDARLRANRLGLLRGNCRPR